MPQSNQECMARRCQSSDTKNVVQRYNAGYDCELPLEIRTELIAPQATPHSRPPIIIRERSNRGPWAGDQHLGHATLGDHALATETHPLDNFVESLAFLGGNLNHPAQFRGRKTCCNKEDGPTLKQQ